MTAAAGRYWAKIDGYLGIDAVLVEQVDRLDPQPSQGGVGDLLDVLGPAGQAGLAAFGVEGEPELGGDHDLPAERFEGFPDECLVDERPVDLGGVEEGDAAFGGCAEPPGTTASKSVLGEDSLSSLRLSSMDVLS